MTTTDCKRSGWEAGCLLSPLLIIALLSTPSLGQSVQWPIADVPHDDSYVVGTYYDFRDHLVGQPDEDVGSFHHAVDIRATQGTETPVVAVAPGRVRFRVMNFTEQEMGLEIYQGGVQNEPKTYFHRIDVCDLTDDTKIWAYLHVTDHYRNGNLDAPWLPGKEVATGDHLGMIATPTGPGGFEDEDLAHVHLSRRRYTDPIELIEAYAVGIQNPLELLEGYTDSHNPIIPGEHGTNELAFRNNIQTGEGKEYFEKEYEPFWPIGGHYVVHGQVDILANINDWTDPSWKGAAGPYRVGYRILREVGDGTMDPYPEVETFVAHGQGSTTEAPTNDLVGVIYEIERGNTSVGSFGKAGDERFIYIVTNRGVWRRSLAGVGSDGGMGLHAEPDEG